MVKFVAISIFALALGTAQAAEPDAARIARVGSLAVVDSAGRVVGKALQGSNGLPAVLLDVGSASYGVNLYLAYTAAGEVDGGKLAWAAQNQMLFVSADCTGTGYFFTYPAPYGMAPAATMPIAGGRVLLYPVASVFPTQYLIFNSYFASPDGRQPPVCTTVAGGYGPISAVPVVANPIDITDLFRPPFTLR